MKRSAATGITLLAFVGLALGLVACDQGDYEYASHVIQTLHPLVAEGQGAPEPGLVGDWIFVGKNSGGESAAEQSQGEETEEFIRFAPRKKDGDYDLFLIDYEDDPENPEGPQKESIRERYRCRAIWLGRSLFLDLVSQEEPSLEFWIPAHGIYRVELDGDEMRLGVMTREWLEKRIEEKRVRVPYAQITPRAIVLTGTTDELQEFFTDYAWDDEAFESVGPFGRKPAPLVLTSPGAGLGQPHEKSGD